MHRILTAAALATLLGACAHGGMHHGGMAHEGMAHAQHGDAAAHAAPAPMPVGKAMETRVVNAQGANVGFARFRQGPHGVLITLEFNPKALTPGWHGVHLHRNGDCSDPAAGFQAAGAHVGHGGTPGRHGLLNPAGPEDGDLPNIFVADTDGPFAAELFAHGAALSATPHGHHDAALLGPQGAALVIHANADDHQSQPIGNAGARVACAALKP